MFKDCSIEDRMNEAMMREEGEGVKVNIFISKDY